jgi:hypothetical protein
MRETFPHQRPDVVGTTKLSSSPLLIPRNKITIVSAILPSDNLSSWVLHLEIIVHDLDGREHCFAFGYGSVIEGVPFCPGNASRIDQAANDLRICIVNARFLPCLSANTRSARSNDKPAQIDGQNNAILLRASCGGTAYARELK